MSERTSEQLFDHPDIRKYSFEEVPLNRDIYLVDEKWMEQYEAMLLGVYAGKKYRSIGFVSYAAARAVSASSIELSWYANTFDRFHELKIRLPRDQFVMCVDCYDLDEKPQIFVRGAWLKNIHLRTSSVFALVDAIGVKNAIETGALTRAKLIRLRSRIDRLASKYPDVAFISFADSLVLKSNWAVGMYRSKTRYSYRPEILFPVLADLKSAYSSILNMGIYAALAQGFNEYYADALLHVSKSQNHISLNSLGLPFAQLLSIEAAARTAIAAKLHPPSELYLDGDLYRSLRFKHDYDKNSHPKYSYPNPMMTSQSSYFCESMTTIQENLEPSTD